MPPSVTTDERPASAADLRRLENKVDDMVKLLADMQLFNERQQNMDRRLIAVESKTDSNTRKVDRGIWVGMGMYLAGAFVVWLVLQGFIQIIPAHKMTAPNNATVASKDLHA